MKRLLVTGGAGFIGINTAKYFIEQGWNITLYDNLSRGGADQNLAWLKTQGKFSFIQGDMRNFQQLLQCFTGEKYDLVIHLAAQVAVTLSVENLREDFEINALGTFNLLEAIRLENPDAFLINASTNKVYGGMSTVSIHEMNNRHEYKDYIHGIPETYPLDFHSPYGCSKGAADQYVLDYARIYDLETVTMRQSCIYGPHQFGIEDQGWVA